MQSKRRWVAIASVVGIVVVVVTIVLSYWQRREVITDTGDTRRAVENSLEQVVPKTVESASSQHLISAARDLKNERYIASVWIVNEKGKIIYKWRGPGRRGQNVRTLARGDMNRVLQTLQPHTISTSQQLELLTAAAIRSEGEHNDVFRHLVRPVPNNKGENIAFIALAYDVSPKVGNPGFLNIALTLVVMLGFAVYWLGLSLWVYLDARARGEVAALWGLLVLLTNLVGLLAYLIAISKPTELECR